MSPKAERRKILSQAIKRIYFTHRWVYGTPKILKELHKEGKIVSINLVQRLMRRLALKSITRRKWHYQQVNGLDNFDYPNILSQDFSTIAPNQKWCDDVTYIHPKLMAGVIYQAFKSYIHVKLLPTNRVAI